MRSARYQEASYNVKEEKKSHYEKWPKLKRILSILTGTLESILFCGIVFGWPAMAYIYKNSCYFVKVYDEKHILSVSENETIFAKFNYNTDQPHGVYRNFTIACEPGKLEFTYVPDLNTKEKFIPNNSSITTLNNMARDHQELQLSKIFTKSTQFYYLTLILFGIFYDKYGTRYTRFISIIFFTIGCIIAGFTTIKNCNILYFAIPLIASGGMATYFTNLKTPNIFPNIQGTIIMLLNGGLQIASVTFLLAKYLYMQYSIMPNIFWYTWAIFSFVFMMARTLFLMPKYQIVQKKDKIVEISLAVARVESIIESDALNNDAILNTESLKIVQKISKSQTPSLKSTIFQKLYFFHLCWFLSLDHWNISFMSHFLSWAVWLTNNNPKETSYWVNNFGILHFVGSLGSMAVGAISDYLKKNITVKTGDKNIAKYRAASIVLSITSIMAMLAAFLASFKNQKLQILTICLQLTFRACLYGNHAQAILMLYPNEMFGKLFGIPPLCSILSSQLIPVILEFIQRKSSFSVVYKVYSLLFSFTFIFPIYLYKKSRI